MKTSTQNTYLVELRQLIYAVLISMIALFVSFVSYKIALLPLGNIIGSVENGKISTGILSAVFFGPLILYLMVFAVMALCAVYFAVRMFVDSIRNIYLRLQMRTPVVFWETCTDEELSQTVRNYATLNQSCTADFKTLKQRLISQVYRPKISYETHQLFSTTVAGKPSECYLINPEYGQPTMLLRVNTSFTLPDIVIDSRIDSHQSSLPSKYANQSKLPLAGDMEEYFSAFTTKGSEVDALTVLDPAILETILLSFDNCDVELHDNYIDFVWPALLNDTIVTSRIQSVQPFMQQLTRRQPNVESGSSRLLQATKYGFHLFTDAGGRILLRTLLYANLLVLSCSIIFTLFKVAQQSSQAMNIGLAIALAGTLTITLWLLTLFVAIGISQSLSRVFLNTIESSRKKLLFRRYAYYYELRGRTPILPRA